MLPAHRLSWRWWDLFKLKPQLWLEGKGKKTREKRREWSLCVFISLDLDLFFNPQSKKKRQRNGSVPRKSYCVSLEKVKQAFSLIKWLAESSISFHNPWLLSWALCKTTPRALSAPCCERLLCFVEGFGQVSICMFHPSTHFNCLTMK